MNNQSSEVVRNPTTNLSNQNQVQSFKDPDVKTDEIIKYSGKVPDVEVIIEQSEQVCELIEEVLTDQKVIDSGRYPEEEVTSEESIAIPESVKEDQDFQETGECPDEEKNLEDPPLTNNSTLVNSDNVQVTANNTDKSRTEDKTSIDKEETIHKNIEEQQHERVIIHKSSISEDGLFLHCQVKDVCFPFLVDTGASRTIISKHLFSKIQQEYLSLKIEETYYKLQLADGTPLQSLGVVELPIKIGTAEINHKVLIADISDSAILGLDFLKQHSCQLHLDTEHIYIGNMKIPCQQRGSTTDISRITLSQDCVIPARSEIIVNGEVSDKTSGSFCLVEGDKMFQEKYRLTIASTLGSLVTTYLPVRILNPMKEDVKLHRNTTIAYTSPFVEEHTVFDAEDDEPVTDFHMRRIGHKQADTKETQWPCDSISAKTVPEHLEELYSHSTEHLNIAQKEQVCNLLNEFQDVFSKDKNDIGQTSVTEHYILTGDAPPIKQRPRRTPMAFKDDEEKEIKNMLERGIIKESTSPWAAPIVLVRKKDNSTRFCIDYRKLNAVTQKDSYPLPRIQDCLDSLGGSKYFSSMDLASGYWQIPVREEDKPKTAFVSKSGLYEFQFMPFGMVNAPSTFERCMETILRGLHWKTCLIYLDNIIVFSETIEEHLSRLTEVLTRIRDAGLKLKTSKCHFFKREVVFLGHIISESGISTDPAKIESIQNWKTPTNVHEVRSFMGLCSYYRRFIKNFSDIAQPITKLTCKGQAFIWSANCQLAFDKLKEQLTKSPIMAYPREDCTFILDTDASNFGIGAVLSQIQDNQERVIAYGSRSLNKSERQYCTTRKELLAIVNFIKHFRPYLIGKQFLVRSDHQPLKWIFKLQDPTGQTARWLELLAAYDFQVDYRPGKKHGNADGLSRKTCDPRDCSCNNEDDLLPCGPCKKCQKQMQSTDMLMRVKTRQQCNEEPNHHEMWFDTYSREDLRAMQMQDEHIATVITWKEESSTRPIGRQVITTSGVTRNLWLLWDQLELHDGILYRKWITTDNTTLRFIVPRAKQDEILNALHDSIQSGHLGQKKTLARVQRRFYWYQMKESVFNWIQKCEVCQINKRPVKKARAPLGSMITGEPMDRIAIDYVGPLPVTTNGNRYILVLQDYFTKWAEAYAVPNTSAAICANTILNEFVARFGTPLHIHSDQGSSFESDLFQEFCKLLHVKKTRTSPRHPSGNGMVERLNSTLIRMIKSYLHGIEHNWDQNLGCVLGAYRSSVHESTQYTPNKLMLGREVRMPTDVIFGKTPTKTCPTYGEYVHIVSNELHTIHEHARKHLKKQSQYQQDRYNTNISQTPYEVGDIILQLNETRTHNKCQKLQNLWQGPYIITKKLSDLNFEIQINQKGSRKILHHDKLKRFYSEQLPKWVHKLQTRLTEQSK